MKNMKNKLLRTALSLVTACLLVLAILPQRAEAAGASLSGSSSVQAGNSVTLTLSVDSKILGLTADLNCGDGLTFTNYSCSVSGWSILVNQNHFSVYGTNSASGGIITVDAALEKAAEFLAAHGCRGMKESYHILKDHVLTVTYCAEQNGVMCYPDMVKLAVAMDTGEMLRFDAEAYLTSHAERDLPEPAVSEEDARAMAGEGLTVQSEKLAVIPTSGAEEIYCRELICETEDGRHYLLYVNAMTGAQEKILILLEDESGTLAL